MASYAIHVYQNPAPTIPKMYRGYYLTQALSKNNEYDHIIHITSNNIHSDNSTNQLQNAGTYDASPYDQKYRNTTFSFNVIKARIIKNKGLSFYGNVTKGTKPTNHYNSIRKYHGLPPMVVRDHHLYFTSLHPKGIVKLIKFPHTVITVNNLKISPNLANQIKNSNAENVSAFQSLKGIED